MTRIALLLITVLIIALSGCAAAEISTPAPAVQVTDLATPAAHDIPSIIARQAKAMKSVNSCQADMQLAIIFKPITSNAKSTSIKAEMNSYIDVAGRLLDSTVYTDLTLAGVNQKATQQIRAIGDSVYIKESRQGPWQRKTLEKAALENLWNEQEQQITGLKYAEMISPGGFVDAGKEKINGHTCYMLKQTLDTGQIAEMTGDVMQDLYNAPGLDPKALEESVKDAELVCLIDTGTFYLREFRLSARIDRKAQGQAITGSLSQSFRFDAFNEPVSVEAPDVDSHE